MAGAIAGAMENGSAPAMLNTPRSLAALFLSGSTSTTRERSTATYMPKPSPLMAIPTRKPLKLLAMAITNSARPYTIDAVRTKIFRRPVRSESLPPMREAATRTTDLARVPRKICCGTSASALPILSSR
jgi:hypothetical protein